MSLKSAACLDQAKISPFELGYLQAAARDEAYAVVLRVFLAEHSKDPTITRAFLARRSGKTPDQITRYLGSPGNWTLDTLAVLLASMGFKPTFGAERIADGRLAHDWIKASTAAPVRNGNVVTFQAAA